MLLLPRIYTETGGQLKLAKCPLVDLSHMDLQSRGRSNRIVLVDEETKTPRQFLDIRTYVGRYEVLLGGVDWYFDLPRVTLLVPASSLPDVDDFVEQAAIL